MQAVNDQVDASIKISASSSIAMIDSQLFQLRNDLTKLNSQISDEEKKLSAFVDICQDFTNCAGCLVNDNCVWLAESLECVPGDIDGPFDGASGSFDYQECTNKECMDYDSCSTCLAQADCGWCENGRQCILDEQKDSCDETFYYSESSGRIECVDEGITENGSTSDVYVSANSSDSTDEEQKEIEERLS